ncbi:hypothetical protein F511_10002 [Dorcoceras hygrometricum]|uniref:Uncharacterized protein n=1 Tax=Dorcoceras hygrometricum TaxID=472368 RepID=A0A2Z7CEV6_9LAMI|nr:hypothetical protein F511_10002 [Dorcoceras hygrometricum]
MFRIRRYSNKFSMHSYCVIRAMIIGNNRMCQGVRPPTRSSYLAHDVGSSALGGRDVLSRVCRRFSGQEVF